MVKPILLFFVPFCGFCIAKRTAKIGTGPELPRGKFKKRRVELGFPGRCTPLWAKPFDYQIVKAQCLAKEKVGLCT
jgi:hypothetical protein